MRLVWGCLLFAALAFAAHPPRSACNKQTHGRLWPEEANTDRSVALRLMRSGEVYLCSYGRLHYRWEPLSTNLKSLEARHAKADATEPPAAASTATSSSVQ